MVTLPAAAGSLSLSEHYMMLTLADATAFRTWCGAATQALALARIHQDGLPEPAAGGVFTVAELNTYRPFAIVTAQPVNGFVYAEDSVGSGFNYLEGGRLHVYFEQQTPGAYISQPGPMARTIKNSIGAIADGILGLAGLSGYLAIRRLVIDGPYRSQLQDVPAQDDVVGWYFHVNWGAS